MEYFNEKIINASFTNYYNFNINKSKLVINNFGNNIGADNLKEAKKNMADQLLEKLRNSSDSLFILEKIGYTEEILMNMIVKYNNYSGLDMMSCIYALEANENNMESYL